MNGEPGFALHPLAAQDITEIWEYIAADNPLAAGRVRQDIHKAIRGLITFPERGHTRTDLTSRPLRFIRVRQYLIAYAPDKKHSGSLPSSTAAATFYKGALDPSDRIKLEGLVRQAVKRFEHEYPEKAGPFLGAT